MIHFLLICTVGNKNTVIILFFVSVNNMYLFHPAAFRVFSFITNFEPFDLIMMYPGVFQSATDPI